MNAHTHTYTRTHMKTPLFLLSLTLIAAAGCGKGKPAAAADPAAANAITVRAVAATNRVFERRLTVQGTLEAKTFANVAARVAGNLDAIWVDEGDRVTAGETRLFQIDPVALSNAVTAAEQNLDVARAGLAVARASRERVEAEARKAALDFARYERLHKEKKVSDNEFETADTLHRQARAGIAVAEAQMALAQSQAGQAAAALAIARKNLDDARGIAPLSGVVSRRDAEPGEQMAVGRALLTIVDLDSIEAAAFIPAQYYPDIVPGETTFRLAVNGRAAGIYVITYRSPTINPVLRTFEIKGAVRDASGAAVPGAMADVTLVFETRQGIGVPTAAVLARGGREVVFVARDGTAVQTAVTTGLQNDGWTEIRSGLEPGVQVVSEGQTQLHDGAPVDIR